MQSGAGAEVGLGGVGLGGVRGWGLGKCIITSHHITYQFHINSGICSSLCEGRVVQAVAGAGAGLGGVSVTHEGVGVVGCGVRVEMFLLFHCWEHLFLDRSRSAGECSPCSGTVLEHVTEQVWWLVMVGRGVPVRHHTAV